MNTKDFYLGLAVQYLDLLADSGYYEWRCGICGVLEDRDYFAAYQFMKEQQEEWVYYSGNHTFPIPRHLATMTQLDAFLHLRRDGGLWSGNQLMYRRAFLRFLIRRATEEASRYE